MAIEFSIMLMTVLTRSHRNGHGESLSPSNHLRWWLIDFFLRNTLHDVFGIWLLLKFWLLDSEYLVHKFQFVVHKLDLRKRNILQTMKVLYWNFNPKIFYWKRWPSKNRKSNSSGIYVRNHFQTHRRTIIRK